MHVIKVKCIFEFTFFSAENSSSADSQDVLLSEGLTDVPLVDSIDTEKNAAGSEDISETNNDAQHSSTNADSKEDHSNEDSLFAKLVNQSNPYERISRHIPCAYTPTPQTRGVQPKNKTLNAKSSVNSSKAIENLEKTPGYSDGYNSVNNNKQNSSTYVPSQSQEVNSIKNNHSNNLSNEPNNKYSVDFLNNTFPSKNSEFKISFFENQESKSLSYEPQSTSKSIISHLDKNVAEGK